MKYPIIKIEFVYRRSWRNRISSLEDYHASLGILYAKECKDTPPLFLGSTVVFTRMCAGDMQVYIPHVLILQ